MPVNIVTLFLYHLIVSMLKMNSFFFFLFFNDLKGLSKDFRGFCTDGELASVNSATANCLHLKTNLCRPDLRGC